ncbi:homoserine dehydrogenase [Oscillospiraceae bacterium LTW-04]|nr:homoserine dehydrogenase [Oscillospiraceae bacterium MB24-C1]
MKIAIIGYGVVGSGVAEVFYKNRARITNKAGKDLDVKYIVDIRSLAGTPYADKSVTDFEIVLNDPEVGIVVETIGGLKPAYDFSKRSLLAGKHVVTSNKELVATHGAELLAIAKEKNVNYLFEASVGGGIPVLHPLYQCLGSGDITEVAGILNGTTNFIMTRMIEDNMSFEDALKLAQKNGYAEQNPAADVEGKDACRKICILASLVYGKHVYPDEVHTEGITNITLNDVSAASKAGYAIKLIGRVKTTEQGLMAMVSPALVSKSSQLGNVTDVFNAVLVRGSDLGDVLFYGRGAGKAPTASAVISDIVDAARADGNIPSLGWEDAAHDTLIDYRSDVTPLMLRVAAKDEAAAAEMFGCVQKIEGYSRDGETAFITPALSGEQAEKLTAQAAQKNVSILSLIRVLDY